jgi:nitrogen regulatory protein P-II 1
MQKVEAIIKEEKFDPIRIALEKKGFFSMTVSEVSGRGRQKGLALQWRKSQHQLEFLPKIKIELVVGDKDLDEVLDTICSIASTGMIGDGKIFVTPISEVIRVRNGDKGAAAV